MKKFLFAISLSVFLFLAAAEAWANPLTYTIDYRNPSISIPEEKKQAVIDQALKNWPNSKIKISWDYVYNSAINHNWNPAFVIALWLEESGASGVSAYDLGCLGGSPNNIPSQLNCLFSRPYANETFRTFMCKYSGEKEDCYTNPNYNFSNNPYFPTNLGIWYYRLAGNAGLGGNVDDDGEPTEPGGSFYTEETIFLKDSLASNDLLLDYRYHREESYPTPPPPTPNISSAQKVQGDTTEKGTKSFDGELNITEEGKNLPNFKIMEKTLSLSLERLLPESLRKELSINPQEISGKTRHFVYGLSENKKDKLPIDNAAEEIPREIPEEKAAFPSWWGRLIGESKVVCGLFNTCLAPESLKIKVAAADEYNPPEGLGHRNSSSLVDEENLDNKVISSRFNIISFFTKIIEENTEFFEYWGEVLIAKKETTTTTALAETRAIVPGGENIRENTSFFKNFLPASAIPAHHNSPLKVSADYEVSSEYTLRGEEKLEYHNLGATRRNYCLSLCSQYPAGFNISQIDPLCPSCNPDDDNYKLEGYGDIPLSQDFCQFQNGAGCHYYDPTASEGCGENQDPVCEGGKCNPYEFYTDDYVKKCGTTPWYGSCRDVNVCELMTFAKNPAGGFGECQYANPNVCVRTDRLEVGKCAAVCNWACCAEQEKK